MGFRAVALNHTTLDSLAKQDTAGKEPRESPNDARDRNTLEDGSVRGSRKNQSTGCNRVPLKHRNFFPSVCFVNKLLSLSREDLLDHFLDVPDHFVGLGTLTELVVDVEVEFDLGDKGFPVARDDDEVADVGAVGSALGRREACDVGRIVYRLDERKTNEATLLPSSHLCRW